MSLLDQVNNLVNNTSTLVDSVNVSKQVVERASQNVQTAITTHEVAENPHEQYVNEEQFAAMANSIIVTQNELLEVSQTLNTHEGAEDPHNQYVRKINNLNLAYLNEQNNVINSDGLVFSGGEVLIALSGVKSVLTNSLTETALFTAMIPDGIMGPNSGIEIQPVWTHTNSANTKTLRVRIGTTIAGQTAFERARTTSQYEAPLIRYVNRGVLNSQINAYSPSSTFALNNASGVESLRDYNFAQTGMRVFVTGQLTNLSEEIALQSVLIKILNPRR